MILNGAKNSRGLELFSTNTVPPRKRVGYWNDLSCESFTGVVVDSAGEVEFSAGLRRLKVDTVCVADVRSSASVVRHTAGHVSRLREEPSFLLHIQLSGASANRQSGREAILQPGDATICDTARPWTLSFNENARFLVCRLPTSKMRQRLPNVEDLPGVRWRHTAGGLCVLSSFLQTLLMQAGQGENSSWLDDVDTVVLDLVAMSCRSSLGSETAPPPHQSRFDQVLRYIVEHVSDPKLDVRSVASQFGVGPRSIQKMFAANGTTLRAFVSKQRLRNAATRLSEHGTQSITEIALDAGFNDLTYFGRVFREVFGVSPREYRRANSQFRANH